MSDFYTNPEKLLNSLKEYYQINKDGNGQEIEVITSDVDEKLTIFMEKKLLKTLLSKVVMLDLSLKQCLKMNYLKL